MSPIQSEPDAFMKLLYRIYYTVKGWWYALTKPSQKPNNEKRD